MHDLVTKKVYPVVPPKVEYRITEFGKTLIPAMALPGKWGDDHEEYLWTLILKRLEIR